VFQNDKVFNGDLSTWDVSDVTDLARGIFLGGGGEGGSSVCHLVVLLLWEMLTL
jgi:surface protein